jgi:D-glycero-alpha-D-manno-heptose-7-phosphate kinase
MIVSRTPYRISFFGGGTDYPSWYHENGGQVLSATIDKYCYLTLRYLPPFFEHRYRVVYSKVETVREINEIRHPIVREVLKYLGVNTSLEIHHDGDLPARSGMGSSSSFAVGLLHALYALNGCISHKQELAEKAIRVEQELVGDTVGSQDQTAAAHGGLNNIKFHRSGRIEVCPVTVGRQRVQALNDSLMLFFTGVVRTASDVAESYVESLASKARLITTMGEMADEGMRILGSHCDLRDFGDLLNQAWVAKRSISSSISNQHVDNIYERARNAGALGGKLTGAGGGGFLLLFVPPEDQHRVRKALNDLLWIPFRFEFNGSQIIFYDPNVDNFKHIKDERDDLNLRCFTELSKLKVK